MKIDIDAQPYATTNWYSVIYTDENDKDYELTICIDEDENIGSHTKTVTWVEAVPHNWEDVETEIKKMI